MRFYLEEGVQVGSDLKAKATAGGPRRRDRYTRVTFIVGHCETGEAIELEGLAMRVFGDPTAHLHLTRDVAAPPEDPLAEADHEARPDRIRIGRRCGHSRGFVGRRAALGM